MMILTSLLTFTTRAYMFGLLTFVVGARLYLTFNEIKSGIEQFKAAGNKCHTSKTTKTGNL